MYLFAAGACRKLVQVAAKLIVNSGMKIRKKSYQAGVQKQVC
jgi:hypothetical protein